MFDLFTKRSVTAFLAQQQAAARSRDPAGKPMRTQYVWRPNGGDDGQTVVLGCAVNLICETYAARMKCRKRQLANEMFKNDPTDGIVAIMNRARDQVADETKSLIATRVAARRQQAQAFGGVL